MVRTKQTARLSCGPGVPKPLNRGHPDYPANAQARYEKAEAAYEKVSLDGEPLLSDTRDGGSQGPSGGMLDRLTAARQWRDQAKAEADSANDGREGTATMTINEVRWCWCAALLIRQR
jgi:hypothetical protein